MCAGLYPNIARVRSPCGRSSRRPCQWETKLEKNIQIHPKSINSKLRVMKAFFIQQLRNTLENVFEKLYSITYLNINGFDFFFSIFEFSQ